MGFVCYSIQQHSNPANGSCQQAEEEEEEEMAEENGQTNRGGGAGTGKESCKLAHLAELVS